MNQSFDVTDQDRLSGIIAYYAKKRSCEVCAMPTNNLWRMFPGGPIRTFCSVRCAGPAIVPEGRRQRSKPVVTLDDLLA